MSFRRLRYVTSQMFDVFCFGVVGENWGAQLKVARLQLPRVYHFSVFSDQHIFVVVFVKFWCSAKLSAKQTYCSGSQPSGSQPSKPTDVALSQALLRRNRIPIAT